MARFDVYRFDSPAALLLVDIQAELLSGLTTRVVLPLVPADSAKGEIAERLKPVLHVDGGAYVLMTTDIGVVAKHRLGERIANIETPYRDTITAAVDFLLQGF